MKADDVKARWMDTSKGTAVAAGDKLQIPIPDLPADCFLSVDFAVDDGRSCDFDIMFEPKDDPGGAIRLYGPTRRARDLSTVVPIKQAGTAYVTFDNIGSWVQQKFVGYTLCVSDVEPQDAISTSTLAFGRNITRQLPTGGAELPSEPTEPTALKEVVVAAGAAELVAVDVQEGQSLEVAFEVVAGGDVDFLMVVLPLGADGAVDEEGTPTRLYGPTRRSSKLHTKMIIPHAGSVQLQFDATSSWFRSKTVRYSLECRAEV